MATYFAQFYYWFDVFEKDPDDVGALQQGSYQGNFEAVFTGSKATGPVQLYAALKNVVEQFHETAVKTIKGPIQIELHFLAAVTAPQVLPALLSHHHVKTSLADIESLEKGGCSEATTTSGSHPGLTIYTQEDPPSENFIWFAEITKTGKLTFDTGFTPEMIDRLEGPENPFERSVYSS